MNELIGGEIDGRYILLSHIQRNVHALKGVLGFGLTGPSSLLTSANGGAEKQRVHPIYESTTSSMGGGWGCYDMTFISISPLKT